MIEDLFSDDDSLQRQWRETLSPGAVILRGYAADHVEPLLQEITTLVTLSPFRHLITPGLARDLPAGQLVALLAAELSA